MLEFILYNEGTLRVKMVGGQYVGIITTGYGVGVGHKWKFQPKNYFNFSSEDLLLITLKLNELNSFLEQNK